MNNYYKAASYMLGLFVGLFFGPLINVFFHFPLASWVPAIGAAVASLYYVSKANTWKP